MLHNSFYLHRGAELEFYVSLIGLVIAGIMISCAAISSKEQSSILASIKKARRQARFFTTLDNRPRYSRSYL